jgi:hypothetical protein
MVGGLDRGLRCGARLVVDATARFAVRPVVHHRGRHDRGERTERA